MAKLWTAGGKLIVIGGRLCLQDTCPCPCGGFCTPPPTTMYVQEKGTLCVPGPCYACNECEEFWSTKKPLTYVDDGESCNWFGEWDFDCTEGEADTDEFHVETTLFLTKVPTGVQVFVVENYYDRTTELWVNLFRFRKIVTGTFDCSDIGDVPFMASWYNGSDKCFDRTYGDWVIEVST